MEKRGTPARADMTKEWPELPNVHATQLSCNNNHTDLHTSKWPALVDLTLLSWRANSKIS